jgi:hypothetical protein
MAILKKSFGDELYSREVKFTKRAKDSLGASHYNIHTAIKELVNNFIVNLYFVQRYKRHVRGQVVIDTTNMKLYVIDDMIGWDEKIMTEAMDMGVSFKTPAIMSKYGMGLKYVVPYLGDLDEIRTSRDGKKYFSMIVDDTSRYYGHRVLKSNEPLQRFNVETQDWEKFDGCGSMVVIDLDVEKHFFSSTRIPKNLSEKFQDAYQKYLGESVSLEIVWLKDDEIKFHKQCQKHTPLLSAERVIQDDVINPDTNKPYEHIDKSRKIGPDIWEVDEIYQCPKTGIIVKPQIGFVPHPKNLLKHYEETKDPKYCPDNYKDNIYRYGGQFKGITYTQEGVAITGGEFSMDRKDGIYGTIEIVKGIETTSDKTSIERTLLLDEFEYEFTEWLRRMKILVRSTATNNRIDEDEMEEKLMVRLGKSSKLRKYLGVDGYDFDNQYSGCTSGIPDIVALDKALVKVVFELKKEGGPDIPSAHWQGTSYCQELDIKDLIVVAQDFEIASDVQIKVNIWNKKGWNIRYEQYQTLVSESVFPIDK